MYAVKLNTQLDVGIVVKKPEQSFLDFCYENIGCQYVETVHPRYLQDPYVLIIDEEGRLKEEPAVNFIASYLYGAHEHHEPIVGNALVMKLGMTNNGPDILPLDEAEARQVEESMRAIAHVAYRKVLVAFRSVFVGEVEKEADDKEKLKLMRDIEERNQERIKAFTAKAWKRPSSTFKEKTMGNQPEQKKPK